MTNDLSKSKKITYFSILTALVIVLQFTASAIKIGAVTLNFVLVPIIICGIILGCIYGALLGAVAGLVILLAGVIGMDGFTNVLFADYPIGITLICILKTTIAGAFGGLIYKVFSKKNKSLAIFMSSSIVPITNTGIFILGMLMMQDGLIKNGFLADGTSALVGICVGIVTFNFFFELALNIIVAPAIYKVLTVLDKSVYKQ